MSVNSEGPTKCCVRNYKNVDLDNIFSILLRLKLGEKMLNLAGGVEM